MFMMVKKEVTLEFNIHYFSSFQALVFAFCFMALILYRPPPKPSNFPTLPGDQMSQSSTLQMINRSKYVVREGGQYISI